MNPCFYYCYKKQYDESCDNSCDYARIAKMRKEWEKKIDYALMEVRSMSTSDGLIRAEIVQGILEKLK